MLLSQLEYFRVLAKHEHVSHAAEELRIAQPALSNTLSKLEKELGMPLFDRVGRSITLNDAGKRLLAHTEYLFEQLEMMERAMEQTKEILENVVTISVNNSMFFANWLQNFVLDHPKIRLHQRMLSESQMIDALLDESIDVAIGEFNEDIPGIVRKVLVNDEYVFTVMASHPLAKKKTILFEDVRDIEVIALPSNTTAKIADRVYAQKDCQPKIIFEGSHRMMSKLEMEGNGIVFATKQMFYAMVLQAKENHQFDEYEPVIIHTISDIDCHCNLCMCWKEGRELPAMAGKFIEAMDSTYPRYTDDREFLKEYGRNWDEGAEL